MTKTIKSKQDSGVFTKAQWIWRGSSVHDAFNETLLARKSFTLQRPVAASLAITADSYYRLHINGTWVNDGPARCWPEHYQYDVIDVTPYLCAGVNEIRVTARYFGVGTFHQVPLRGGLLAELRAVDETGCEVCVGTDDRWQVSAAPGWEWNVPKVSIQMEPFEAYDARFEEDLHWEKPRVLGGPHDGPWKNLTPRDCPLLTKEPVAPERFVRATVVDRDWLGCCFPVARWLYPGLIEANFALSLASAVAVTVVSKTARPLELESLAYTWTVNGQPAKNGKLRLRKGENFLFGVVTDFFGHRQKDTWIRFKQPRGLTLKNPMFDEAQPWCFAEIPDSRFVGNDIVWPNFVDPERQRYRERIEPRLQTLLKQVRDPATFARHPDLRIRPVAEAVPTEEVHGQFVHRNPVQDGVAFVDQPFAAMYNTPETTLITPSPKGDIELLYDLGVQRCGYYSFELIAEAGAVVDLFGVEYIAPGGAIQHTDDNRNGLRYVCKEGVNTFTSLKRRSQRYVFLTLRNLTRPVELRLLRVIESTYPVDAQGAFASSDPALDRIWEISARTLKLCMEDTFTDCPLYEQTHWVGDARNEAVFAFTAFGAADLAQRCIALTGQSLERYPITGCQVPSTWDCLLPAWSFLWGISVWDAYFYTGDAKSLKKQWKWVVRNLKGAERLVDERGLFSGPFWNMFDWTNIDCGHKTVLHNSMFLVGAIDAAVQCARVLGEKQALQWLLPWRDRLVRAINATWQKNKGSYPDSIHDDGSVSPSTCTHTSFLALLYDIVPPALEKQALANTVAPGKAMVRVGSPFAIMYLYEALEKCGQPDAILESIRENYQPMLDVGATTVWEVFGNSNISGSFPTRSHCHAWSSAPVHFLNRIVLGIHQVEPGGAAYTISPWVKGLSHASGATAGVRGPVRVSWRKTGKRLEITAQAGRGVKLRFETNTSLKGLEVVFNGKPVKGA